MRAGSDVDPPMAARLPGDGADGRLVVGVHTDEEVVVSVPDGGQIVLQHAADDGMLLPERDEDRDGTLVGPAHVGVRRPREAEPAGHKPDQGDKQVIQPADRNPDRDRHQAGGNPLIQPAELE